MRRRTLAAGGALAGIGAGLYALVVRGDVTIDLGIGRTSRPLGPLTVHVDAPREVVFDVIADPYLGRTPRALQRKLRVVERGEDMVLAAHFTSVGPLEATTVETVRFERPERVAFRLVRGPVPHVLERFELRERAGATELEYEGELGADLWLLGRCWGWAVARTWEKRVRASLASVKDEAERRAASR